MSLPTRYAVRLLLPVIFHAIKESKWLVFSLRLVCLFVRLFFFFCPLR
jgi:hypothetical protein